jgi:predicted RNA-binding protein with PUA-like domain
MTRYWLIKSEPLTYSIEDMKKEKKTHWDGIRNYQARNIMRDEMEVGDLAIFYHSNAKPPGAAGIVKVCKKAYPDHTARDPEGHYYDPKASEEKPIWMMVDVAFVKKFTTFVGLPYLKAEPKLADMTLLKKGMRLSVQPVNKKEFDLIEKMGTA